MAPAPLAQNATQAQAVAYLTAYFGKTRYHNDAKTPYEGMDAAQLYAYLAAQNPGSSPYQVAVSVADLLASSAFAGVVGGSVNATGNALGAITTGVETANYAPWATGLTGLLGALTSVTTWIRVGKVVIGGALIVTGVAHLSGTGSAVRKAASKIPVIPV